MSKQRRPQFADDAMRVPFSGTFASDIFTTANDPSVRQEVGAQLESKDQVQEAAAFMRDNPDYPGGAALYHKLKGYLESRRLAFNRKTLREAWIYLRANGAQTFQQIEAERDSDKLTYHRLDSLPDRDLIETYQSIVQARRNRRAAIEKELRTKF